MVYYAILEAMSVPRYIKRSIVLMLLHRNPQHQSGSAKPSMDEGPTMSFRNSGFAVSKKRSQWQFRDRKLKE